MAAYFKCRFLTSKFFTKKCDFKKHKSYDLKRTSKHSLEEKSMGKPPISTVNGYDLGECVSAFQKCIRRGDEDGALYWAAEIYKSGYRQYPWKRLLVIVSEDIGIAAPGLAAEIFALCQTADWFKKNVGKEDDHDALFLTHAIILACRAPKCRMNDHAVCLYFYSKTPLAKRQVPDAALDMHTRRGRSMKRGVEHFWEEAAHLENRAEIDDPYWTAYQQSWLDQEKHKAAPANETQKPEPPVNGQLFDGDLFKNW
ncbi:Replication-associated recombination protein RarA [Nostoc flagelliforme CCNUN1]|uniref:Replication-associated recombination protein RarA n=1 Tax=Nostoc flagelliforme CCNUN1 TaxID=2038116 RepID=A0A2K8SLE0_9NOSO|nr:hypothetical protein [Nostoc flagelliforme]AUB36113.1 Replication-associated recombination protein RarA [Nostoc flagelliforme CCNUN1]